MLDHIFIATLKPTFTRSFRRWIFNLGGLGFFPLGLLDASIIPVPGSMDVLTIVLSARRTDLWLYYALMATAGSVAGGFAMYRLARKGGKEMLARKISPRRLEKVYTTFHRWGFGSIAVPALLPPPIPMVPFLLAAGALQYSVGRFLTALTVGRTIRFALLAFLAAHYGRGVLTFVSKHGHPVTVTIVVVIAMIVAVLFVGYMSKRQGRVQA